jgi:hypothetical protein
MKFLIGCPIYKRDWIIDYWLKCIKNQSVDISNIGFIFEVSEKDTKTVSLLEWWRKKEKNIPYFDIRIRPDIEHFEHQNNGRQWTISKYENMVSLRNSLLTQVRKIRPEVYFSLDSDILLTNNSTLELLLTHINSGADAVSPLMFMTPMGIDYPSVMSWKEGFQSKAYRERSYPLGTYFESDVIMAAKMMSPKVYNNIDYEIHIQGEDLGWSLKCREKGYKLFCASYIYCPHIMNKEMLSNFLLYGDERQKFLNSKFTCSI